MHKIALILIFCVVCMISAKAKATTAEGDTVKNLVLSGGGTWGISYCGALEELDQMGKLKHLERVAGTSVGAIAAMALSLGYSTEEISKMIDKLNVQQFNDPGFPLISGTVHMTTGFGWYSGHHFHNWLDKVIKAKTGNGSMTFRQLHEMAKEKHYLDLYITGTNLTQQKMVIFSYETYPDMKIKDAVRISMSVPLYFCAVLMDKDGHVVKRSTEEHPADVMIDGGVINNFPIDIFDAGKYCGATANPNEKMVNPYTIGIRVQSDSQIVYDMKNQGLAPHEIGNIKDYVIAFYTFILEKLNKESREPENLKRTIAISTMKYGQRVRYISKKQKNDLFESGREAVRRYYGGMVEK